MASERSISVSRIIGASPQDLFDVVADPSRHPEIDGSGTVRRTLGPHPDRLSLGSKFGMAMRIGLPYPIRNVVKEFDEGRLIAWSHAFGHRWRYEFEPVEGGTRVTETFDWSTARVPEAYYRVTGFLERNPKGMEATLERLERVASEQAAD